MMSRACDETRLVPLLMVLRWIEKVLGHLPTFFLILNIHFWNYYVPLGGVMQGNTPSITSTQILWVDFPSHPRSQFPFITFRGSVQQNKGKCTHSP